MLDQEPGAPRSRAVPGLKCAPGVVVPKADMASGRGLVRRVLVARRLQWPPFNEHDTCFLGPLRFHRPCVCRRRRGPTHGPRRHLRLWKYRDQRERAVLDRHPEQLHDRVRPGELRGRLRGSARADVRLAVHRHRRCDVHVELRVGLHDAVHGEPADHRLHDRLQLALRIEL